VRSVQYRAPGRPIRECSGRRDAPRGQIRQDDHGSARHADLHSSEAGFSHRRVAATIPGSSGRSWHQMRNDRGSGGTKI
jgi:hypothetical protein